MHGERRLRGKHLAAREASQLVDQRLVKLESLKNCEDIHTRVMEGAGQDVCSTGSSEMSSLGTLSFSPVSKTERASWLSRCFDACKKVAARSTVLLFLVLSRHALASQRRKLKKLVQGKFVKVRCLKLTRSIHLQAVKRGCELELFVASTLLDVYSTCGSLTEARQIFEKIKNRNVVSWNCMILGYAEGFECEVALELYERMLDERECEPDAGTFVAALKACSNLRDTAETNKKKPAIKLASKVEIMARIKVIHSRVLRAGLLSEVFVANTLLDAYAKCGSMVDTYQVLDKMEQTTLVSWNCIIQGYGQLGNPELALEVFSQACNNGFEPDTATFIAAITACGILAEKEDGQKVEGKVVKLSSLEKGRAIHFKAASRGTRLQIQLESSLVDFYCKCGSLTDARRVFESMQTHNIFSWTNIILGFAQNGESELALGFYQRMLKEGETEPDALTFVAVLQACGNLVALEAGRDVHERIRAAELEADEFVANALVNFYGKCGSMAEAQEIFDSFATKNLETWSSLMFGYGLQCDTGRVFQILDAIKEQNLELDEMVYLLVLTACSHAGLVDKAKEFFLEMVEERSLPPRLEHYTCMVDLLGRANQLSDAVTMVRSLPVEPTVEVWMVLLGACWKWKNLDVGRLVFSEVMELDKSNSRAYVLMSHIASLGKGNESTDSR